MAAYEYRIVEVREGLIGGKRSLVEVKGRVGPGGADGLPVTFERARG